MPLEAMMIVVDNSESSRNGDYTPTRFEAQADAVSIIFQNVTTSHPQSSVGLMSMGGKGPEVLVTLNSDQGKILDGLHRTRQKIGGEPHLTAALQVAGLALKHRKNTNAQRQRIVVFVCSPIEETEKELVKLARKMKKHTVAVDFVLFGDVDDDTNETKLRAFHEAVNSGDTSNLIVIPPSGQLLSDMLLDTPILLGDGAGARRGGGGTGGDGDGDFGEFDFNPNLDPELALALRLSMEEEKVRREREERRVAEEAAASKDKATNEGEGAGNGEGSSSPATAATPANQDEKTKQTDSSKKDDVDKMDTS